MSIVWDDAKEQVRSATEIVDLIGSYLSLRRQGRNYVGLCPWHDDSRPSFQVNPERQSWRCWVCDIGGDVFSFVMKRESVDFREALELLADRAGIPLTSRGTAKAGQDKRALFQILAWAEQQFHDNLMRSPDAEAARQYLHERGIFEESTKRFRIGFSPDSWDWLIKKARRESYSDEQLRITGLTSYSESSRSTYDRFRGRILFSIRDAQRRTVGFGGRVMPGVDAKGAKYVNSPETPLFSKSDLLYALDTVRDEVSKQRHVIVVEGYTDAIMAFQQGVGNVVAVLGTALGERHIQMLKRYCDRVTLVLDGDEAGQRRTNEILQLFLNHSIDLRIATMPDGQDPCDFLINEGAEAFHSLIDAAQDALYHKISVATLGVNLTRDLHGSNKALEEILEAVAKMDKTGAADVAGAQLKERQLLAHLCRRFDIPEVDLRQRLKSLRRREQSRLRTTTEQPTTSQPIVELHDWDRELLEILVACPDMIDRALMHIGETQLQTEAARTIFSVYRCRYRAGKSIEFPDVMLAMDAPETKSLLVELDEDAAKKAELRKQPGECLEAVLQAFARRDLKGQCRDEIRRLEDDNLSEEEQLKAVETILKNQRSQQGISAPTDG